MLYLADFDEVFDKKPDAGAGAPIPCESPTCFIGSYAPVARPGENGPFFVNSYLLQPDRIFETQGATLRVTSSDYSCMK